MRLNPFGNRVVGDAEVNLLHNACDVGINTAMGEGWGLVSCEHGAAIAAAHDPARSWDAIAGQFDQGFRL